MKIESTPKPKEQIEIENMDDKFKAILKNYSRQTKIYPPTEWWDWDSN